MLDVDIRGFFDTIDHGWLVKFVEHRIADRRVVRLIQKWLNAGVLEDGKRMRVEEGTPQGGSASPLAGQRLPALRVRPVGPAWRRTQAHGDVIVVRFADDIVVGFQSKSDAERFWKELARAVRQVRTGAASREDAPAGVRPVRGRTTESERGQGKPETFNFLGFTHICGEEEKQRKVHGAAADDAQAAAGEAEGGQSRAAAAHARSHPGDGQVAARGRRGAHPLLRGAHERPALQSFRFQVGRLWHRALSRRSQNGLVLWDRMRRHIARWLPPARICHPYPLQATWRHHLRQEPDAGKPLVRICGGGYGQP